MKSQQLHSHYGPPYEGYVFAGSGGLFGCICCLLFSAACCRWFYLLILIRHCQSVHQWSRCKLHVLYDEKLTFIISSHTPYGFSSVPSSFVWAPSQDVRVLASLYLCCCVASMDSEVQKKVVYMPTKGALGCCCFLPFQNLCTHCEPEYSAPQVCACQSWDVNVCVYDPQEREVLSEPEYSATQVYKIQPKMETCITIHHCYSNSTVIPHWPYSNYTALPQQVHISFYSDSTLSLHISSRKHTLHKLTFSFSFFASGGFFWLFLFFFCQWWWLFPLILM